MISCGKKKSGISTVSVDVEEMPMIHTEDITSLVSDSGITRYRLNAKVWDIFQSDTGSYWYFPQGIYVEQFDTLLNVQGYLRADTTYYYSERSLWRAIGNVYIKNLQGITFETEELFMDEKPSNPTYALFTGKFVKVTTADGRVLTGIGMHSDIAMKDYIFYQPGGEFEGYEKTTQNDSITSEENIENDLLEEVNPTESEIIENE